LLLSAQRSFAGYAHQARYRLTTAGNDNLMPLLYGLDIAEQVLVGFAQADMLFHDNSSKLLDDAEG
jgi:hypothetical protein